MESILLIAQLIINLSPPGKFFSAHNLVFSKFFFGFGKNWICLFFLFKICAKNKIK